MTTKPNSPVKLSMVCGLWRKVVVTTPSLWSDVSVVLPSSTLRGTKLFMDRSESAPIMLRLDYPPEETTEDDGVQAELTDLLVSHSNRWKTLDIGITLTGSRHPSFRAIQGRLDKLTNLRLISLDAQFDSFEETFLRAFENAPSLHTVELVDITAYADFILPWHKLETIRLLECDLQRMPEILRRCSNARCVELDRSHRLSSEPSSTARLPNVTVLSAELFDSEDMSGLFRHLEIPNIESLEIHNKGNRSKQAPWDISPVQAALGRSSSTLTLLCMKNIPINDWDMISFLQSVPNLEGLSIWGFNPSSVSELPENMIVTPNFITQLSLHDADVHQCISNSSQGVFLPRLTALTLHVHVNGLDQKALAKSVISRCPAVPNDLEVTAGTKPEMLADTCILSKWW
ncbi:hypothetical protein V5O48_013649 [Marasmius crinis-equi]|uniref:F-box domain-containing protein n=1 Tax=Marasmius crinis-equi TaxID=585013 RepID=A0ABR3EZH7_9AGAR